MLWDCPYCGTNKLLGLTHRHCPNCGAPQDPKARYFPSDEEKVAVEDHEYVGRDRTCPACRTPGSAKTKLCGNCGSPLEGASEVNIRKDQVAEHGTSFDGESVADAKEDFQGKHAGAPPQPPPKRSSRRWWLWGLLGAGVLLVCVIVLAIFWKQQKSVTVSGHSWTREIQVERYGPKRGSNWCDTMPSGAYDISRSREIRSHKKVPDGEKCRTIRKDRGDGTFSEKQKCTTRYRKEPVYDDKCSYKINRWAYHRSIKKSGNSLEDTPKWPEVEISRSGRCVGCERRGRSLEAYSVHFVVDGEEEAVCDYNEMSQWKGFEPGTKHVAEFSAISDRIDCESVTPVAAKP